MASSATALPFSMLIRPLKKISAPIKHTAATAMCKMAIRTFLLIVRTSFFSFFVLFLKFSKDVNGSPLAASSTCCAAFSFFLSDCFLRCIARIKRFFGVCSISINSRICVSYPCSSKILARIPSVASAQKRSFKIP